MSRNGSPSYPASTRFPRPRGDEPEYQELGTLLGAVFPARAGMSLSDSRVGQAAFGFPRPRGDEPTHIHDMQKTFTFSPPARG